MSKSCRRRKKSPFIPVLSSTRRVRERAPWRRAPDAKFRLTPAPLEELNRIQAEILEKAYALTASSGRIVYITCSVLEEENGSIVRHFLERHPDMSTIDMPALWREKTAQPWPCGEKAVAGTGIRW